jgi:CheY-like chemotaxis protein
MEMGGDPVGSGGDGGGQADEPIACLPNSDPPATTPAPSGKPSGGEEETADPGAKRRILVADDNDDSVASMALMLKILGNEVRTASDGREAVEVAETFQPKLILLDIGMPQLNGYEACRAIRQKPWGADVIIVALTGWGQEDDKQKAREAGFNHHLVKPVGLDAIRKLLAEI